MSGWLPIGEFSKFVHRRLYFFGMRSTVSECKPHRRTPATARELMSRNSHDLSLGPAVLQNYNGKSTNWGVTFTMERTYFKPLINFNDLQADVLKYKM